jgi:hypothetical protein
MTSRNIPSEIQAQLAGIEQMPVIHCLLSVIDTLTTQVEFLTNQVSTLTEQLSKQVAKTEEVLSELRRIKKLNDKSKLSASTLAKNHDDNDDFPSGKESSVKRPGSTKRSKQQNLPIDKEEIVILEQVPAGAMRKGYHDYVVQDLLIKPFVTRYRLERWQLPTGHYAVASLPRDIQGYHFGSTLRAYVLHQHHHQGVTQKLLLGQLREWGIDISAGELNRLLIEDKEDFHREKSALLTEGLRVSNYIQVDDTGARHQGQNGFCTFIGNALFSWFESTRSKSRINFLALLRHGYTDYQLTEAAFAYMKRYQVAPWVCQALYEAKEKLFADQITFEKHLKCHQITHAFYKRLVTEGALIGSILAHGFPLDTVILSDDAGQFNVFAHALCWIHAERGIKALITGNDSHASAIEWARHEIWQLYRALQDYKQHPHPQFAIEIEAQFDAFCHTKTNYISLNLVLKRLFKNKSELLLVLKRPDIPLHNNQSECDIRE